MLTRSLREPGGSCTKSMEVSESRMERVNKATVKLGDHVQKLLSCKPLHFDLLSLFILFHFLQIFMVVFQRNCKNVMTNFYDEDKRASFKLFAQSHPTLTKQIQFHFSFKKLMNFFPSNI